ncbi:MAG: hypothetical protein NC218_00345 [Acetobacter sp.]|nr:hypothetical protein [Acetobacter sp.]
MLNISFFIAAFSSIFWFIFSLRYINFTAVFATHNTDALYQTITITLFPVALIWVIFAIIKSYYTEHRISSQLRDTLDLLHKNTDSTANLCTTLLGTEIEIRNGFIINEFDTLISDVNEVLADIIKRSNSISSTQMEHLWTRTAGGERWLIAKTFIETHNFQAGFAEHLLQKAKKDSLLKGSILEFKTRYQSLRNLLETYDKQKLFYNIVEYGALGKVYALITPIAEKILTLPSSSPIAPSRHSSEYTQAEEPLAFPSFFNNNEEKTLLRQPKIVATTKCEDIDNSLKAIRNELLTEPTPAPKITDFSNTHSALQNMKQSHSQISPTPKNKKSIISLDELEKEINASPENNYDEYAYPFGAWMNDKNNK